MSLVKYYLIGKSIFKYLSANALETPVKDQYQIS